MTKISIDLADYLKGHLMNSSSPLNSIEPIPSLTDKHSKIIFKCPLTPTLSSHYYLWISFRSWTSFFERIVEKSSWYDWTKKKEKFIILVFFSSQTFTVTHREKKLNKPKHRRIRRILSGKKRKENVLQNVKSRFCSNLISIKKTNERSKQYEYSFYCSSSLQKQPYQCSTQALMIAS